MIMCKKFFFVIVLFLLLPKIANAFSISPIKYTVTIAAGGEQMISLTVKNDKTATVNYNLLVLGAKQNNAGSPIFESGLSEAENWVGPETEFISLGGGKEKTVNFLINIPGGAYPGFYYLGLAVQERNLKVSGIGLSGRLVSILSLQVAGEAREILQINEWRKEKTAAGGQWSFKAGLENKGNVDLPLRGEMVVGNWRKKAIGRQTVYLGNNLLPATTRNLSLNFNQEKLPWSPWYWVSLEANYGRTGQRLAATYLVWGRPWWFLPAALIIIIIGCWFLFRRIKRS